MLTLKPSKVNRRKRAGNMRLLQRRIAGTAAPPHADYLKRRGAKFKRTGERSVYRQQAVIR